MAVWNGYAQNEAALSGGGWGRRSILLYHHLISSHRIVVFLGFRYLSFSGFIPRRSTPYLLSS